MDQLPITPRHTTMGCGIYEAGDTDLCYVKLFVTDTGFVLPVNHRMITEQDLMDVYKRGYLDGQGIKQPDPGLDLDEDDPE